MAGPIFRNNPSSPKFIRQSEYEESTDRFVLRTPELPMIEPPLPPQHYLNFAYRSRVSMEFPATKLVTKHVYLICVNLVVQNTTHITGKNLIFLLLP